MDQIADLSHPELGGLLKEYLGRISTLLPQVPFSPKADISPPT